MGLEVSSPSPMSGVRNVRCSSQCRCHLGSISSYGYALLAAACAFPASAAAASPAQQRARSGGTRRAGARRPRCRRRAAARAGGRAWSGSGSGSWSCHCSAKAIIGLEGRGRRLEAWSGSGVWWPNIRGEVWDKVLEFAAGPG